MAESPAELRQIAEADAGDERCFGGETSVQDAHWGLQ